VGTKTRHVAAVEPGKHDAAVQPGELLTTKDVAQRRNRTPETVREWARIGRLKPVVTLSSGQRLFSPVDVDQLPETER